MLATNFWVASKSSKIITDAMRELSRRAVQRGKKVVFKLIYDRGNIKQVAENHIVVPEKEFTGKEVQIPAFDEVPGLDLEVVNYHRPAVGTFHSKYMIVDRKIALLNSNNIQDRCNHRSKAFAYSAKADIEITGDDVPLRRPDCPVDLRHGTALVGNSHEAATSTSAERGSIAIRGAVSLRP